LIINQQLHSSISFPSWYWPHMCSWTSLWHLSLMYTVHSKKTKKKNKKKEMPSSNLGRNILKKKRDKKDIKTLQDPLNWALPLCLQKIQLLRVIASVNLVSILENMLVGEKVGRYTRNRNKSPFKLKRLNQRESMIVIVIFILMKN